MRSELALVHSSELTENTGTNRKAGQIYNFRSKRILIIYNIENKTSENWRVSRYTRHVKTFSAVPPPLLPPGDQDIVAGPACQVRGQRTFN